MGFLLKGVLIGILIGIPVGPVGAIAIRRVLISGPTYGLLSGLGASTADLVYGSMVAFGLTFLSDFFVAYQFWFRLLGGILILLVGWKIFTTKPEVELATETNARGLVSAFLSTFLLTITNPTTVVSFLVIFAGYGLNGLSHNFFGALQLVIGVFIGGGLWWVLLTFLTNRFRSRIQQGGMSKINKIFGSIILFFGLLILVSINM